MTKDIENSSCGQGERDWSKYMLNSPEHYLGDIVAEFLGKVLFLY